MKATKNWGVFTRPKPLKHRQILLNFSDLDVTLNFKSNVKNMRLRVGKDAKISLSLPFYATQKSAVEFLQTHKDWLIKTHEKAKDMLSKDDEFVFLGQVYKIKFDENLKEVFIKNNEIWIKDTNMLEKFKKSKAKEIFINFIDKFRPKIKKDINHISIKNMQTRWGSCNSKKGYINLNLNLIQKPPILIEYVILHELSHLIYPHHKSEFYDFIRSIMPDFRQREIALNKK
ncbi:MULTISPECIES: M48 family metallopeptidase [unclassified Campylobacter]|uniref:M48 family metallopeptidase n=1 Tax=unclassified Campylobacter TaxID=2593542 RepID=UPI003D349699